MAPDATLWRAAHNGGRTEALTACLPSYSIDLDPILCENR